MVCFGRQLLSQHWWWFARVVGIDTFITKFITAKDDFWVVMNISDDIYSLYDACLHLHLHLHCVCICIGDYASCLGSHRSCIISAGENMFTTDQKVLYCMCRSTRTRISVLVHSQALTYTLKIRGWFNPKKVISVAVCMDSSRSRWWSTSFCNNLVLHPLSSEGF